MRFDQVLFFANLYLCFHESKWMNETKKNDLIKAKKHFFILKFVNNLNSIRYAGEIGINSCIIYPEYLKLGKENTDKHERIFWV